jgi:hypothetical protein
MSRPSSEAELNLVPADHRHFDIRPARHVDVRAMGAGEVSNGITHPHDEAKERLWVMTVELWKDIATVHDEPDVDNEDRLPEQHLGIVGAHVV